MTRREEWLAAYLAAPPPTESWIENNATSWRAFFADAALAATDERFPEAKTECTRCSASLAGKPITVSVEDGEIVVLCQSCATQPPAVKNWADRTTEFLKWWTSPDRPSFSCMFDAAEAGFAAALVPFQPLKEADRVRNPNPVE